MKRWSPTLLARLLFVRPGWKLTLSSDSLTLRNGAHTRHLSLEVLREATVTSGLAWARCRLALCEGTGEIVVLRGIRKAHAKAMAAALERGLQDRLAALAEGTAPALDDWLTTAWASLPVDRWVRHSYLAALESQRDALEVPGSPLTPRELGRHPALSRAGRSSALDILHRAFGRELSKAAAAQNAAFEEAELAREQAFFDGVESKPLTREQAAAAVCFDDRVLLIAAAGSGKTSTMVARAGYAVRAGIARSDEVLMLAFNAEAARELGERTTARLGPWVPDADRIHTSTFHAFALKVIGEATGRKPSVPDWLGSGQDEGVMVHLLRSLCEADPDFQMKLNLFARVFGDSLGSFASQAEHDNNAPVTTRADPDLITLRGEVVKSGEEKLIADWLAFHGIAYRYERPYHRNTADSGHSQYTPDFYYPDADLYHEHLALDAWGNPPPDFTGYAEGVAWKRELHKADGNRYIETTSAGLRSVDGLDRLKRDLEAHGLKPVPSEENLGPRVAPLDVPRIAKLFRAFLSHYKAQNHHLEELRTAGRRTDFAARSTLFLDLFATVLDAWQARLAQEQAVDFDDMLNRGAELIEAGDWVSPYTVVAVDEWQDTSRARARIVRALTRQDISLAAIGDDYQSIYRFAGSDIRLMTQFESLMGPATTRHLTQTFRCPQHLNDVSTAFVQQNPAQIAKTVLSHNPMEGRSIRCVAYSQNREDALESLLSQLRDHAQRSGQTYSVYLLGRYRHDCPSTLRHLQTMCRPVLSLRFATIHQAKGLEADYVFLLGANAGKAGFPSRIRDDALLDLVMPPREDFADAEDRRLLYVALTRAKRRVIILADQRNPSSFVLELERHGAGPMTTFDGEAAASPCPACHEGVMIQRTSKYGPFLGCSTYPRCRHTSQLETS